MIQAAGVKPTLAPRTKLGTEPSQNAKKQNESATFEEALGKSVDRNERKVTPGREDRRETAREGQRPDDRNTEMRNQREDTSKRNEKSEREPVGKDQRSAKAQAKASDKRKAKDETPDAVDGRETVNASAREVQQPKAEPQAPIQKVEGMETDVPAETQVANAKPSGKSTGTIEKALGQSIGQATPALQTNSFGPNGVVDIENGIDGDANTELMGMMIPVEGEQEASMQDFVERMQSEFGVPPEKIVEAFSKMNEEQLEAPPEVSAKSFIANLGLKDSQKAQATEMYQDLLASTTVQPAAPQAMQVSVMTSNEDAMNKLNDAIDDLNRAFNGKAKPIGQQPLGTNDAQTIPVQVEALQTPKQPMSPEQLQSQLMARMIAKQSEIPQKSEETKKSSGDDDKSIFDAAGLLAGGAALETTADSGKVASDLSQQQSGQQSLANAFKEALQSKTEATKEPVKKGDFKVESSKADVRRDTKIDTDLTAAGIPGAMGATAAAPSDELLKPAQMMPVAPTTKDEQENVKELLRQAQIVLKNGGGELNIALKPQGMGEVKLKVSVDQTGQVSVQMLTDSDQAKRLLEKGLHELKSNLAAENLKVDTLKVDVGSEIKKHMDHQGNQDSSREQARQQASDFMDQFRQEREGFRQGFMESNARKSYNQSQTRGDVDVEASASKSSAKPKSANSSRLNLVA